MKLYSLTAAAKINLYLEIIGNRPDDFHELVMIMQSVSLADRLTLRALRAPTVQLRCDHPQVPTDESNLVCKAVALLSKEFPEQVNQQGGVEITIEKHIPVGAGLAGGSANAAAALVGLNLLWGLGLTQIELLLLGAKLGSDVPFCILGGTAIATGRGETLDPIQNENLLYAVLAKYESLSVSTPWVYQTYRQQFGDTYVPVTDATTLAERQQRVHSGPMVSAIAAQNSAAMGQHLCNDLEKVVLPAHPQVAQLKETMASSGGLGTLMSGSGPTVFTLTETQAAAEALLEQVRSRIPNPDLKLWVTQFTHTGIRLDG
ncbi:MAG: 4-(cytidine 5'-diphospho)-2-C-methyl-D-erythritol kinase [Leptolyngbya sp. SIO4C1]|nr:4-(cytidine 5'-diphospho)-2-C-methyl-D-erythritol kinase [Leptolyngbya sp. SIO4C1]